MATLRYQTQLLTPSEYHHHSGGALGADAAWDEIGREFGIIHHHHYWYGQPNPLSAVEDVLTPEQFAIGRDMVWRANQTLKRQPAAYMNLLARNWQQVAQSAAIFAIGTLKTKKQVNGGTGWAVQMALDAGKPVYAFDQPTGKWYEWETDKFISYPYTPLLTPHFAGIGTRELNARGLQAIRGVYQQTFKSSSTKLQ